MKEQLETEGCQDDRPGAVRRDWVPHRGRLVEGLGVASLFCFVPGLLGTLLGPVGMAVALVGIGLAATALMLGRRDLRAMDTNHIDPRGRTQTEVGSICGLIGVVLGGVALLANVTVVLTGVLSDMQRGIAD